MTCEGDLSLIPSQVSASSLKFQSTQYAFVTGGRQGTDPARSLSSPCPHCCDASHRTACLSVARLATKPTQGRFTLPHKPKALNDFRVKTFSECLSMLVLTISTDVLLAPSVGAFTKTVLQIKGAKGRSSVRLEQRPARPSALSYGRYRLTVKRKVCQVMVPTIVVESCWRILRRLFNPRRA